MRILCILALLSVSFTLHDFHVTHTTIHHNHEAKSLEITVKVALEDLERALEDRGAKKVKIGEKDEHVKADQWIMEYLKKHLKVWPDNQPAEYVWVGKEQSKDLHDLYIYLEIPDCTKDGLFESLTLENTIFTNLLPHQSNIVLLDLGGKHKQNLTFTKAKSKQNLSVRWD